MKDIVLPDIYFLICEIIVVKMQEKEKSCVYYAWGNGNNEKNAAYGIRNGTVSGILHQVTYSDVINIGLPIWEGLVRLLSDINDRNVILIVIVEVLACHTPDEGVVVGAGCCVH